MKLTPKQLDLSKDLIFDGGDIQLADGRIFVGDGTESQPSISFSSDPGTGLFLANPGEIAISAGASAFVYLKDDGTVEMTGTTGLAVQAGTTDDRPDAPLDGLLRYNLDTDSHETYINGEWVDFLLDNDLRFNEPTVVEVRKEPGKRQFSTIADALASITDASQAKPYLIDVGPGQFYEPTLVVPRYVAVRGAPGVTAVRASAPNQHLFHIDVNVNISEIIVHGVSGTDYAAFYCNSSNTTITSGAYLRNIKYGNNSTQVMVEQAAGTYATIYTEGGMIGAHGTFDQGFYAKGPGAARINIRSLATNGTTAPGPTFMFKAEGTQSTIIVAGCLLRNAQVTGTGIHLKNGATGRFVGTSILGFAKAIWLENDGAGPIFNGDGINLQNNTMDIVVDHPQASGHFLGCATRSKVSVDGNANISIFYSDPVTTGITSVGPLYLGPTHAKTTEMSGLFGQATTMGLLSGGELTYGTTPGTINISAGMGYASISDPIPRTTRLSWPNTVLTMEAEAAEYVYVTNTGIVVHNPSMPNLIENILLGRVVTDGNQVVWIDETPSSAFHASNQIESMLRNAFGSVFAEGCTVSENPTTPFTLNIVDGVYYHGSLKFSPTGGTSAQLLIVHRKPGNDWNYIYGGNVVPHTQYDSGTSLTNLSPGYYAKHSLYVAGDGPNELYMLIYAQAQYATLVEAEGAPLPLPPGSFMEGVTTLIASIVVQQGAPNIIEIFDNRPTIGAAAPTLSAASSHGNLLGLFEDDHPQYLLSNGTRKMGGTLDMDGHTIINVPSINGLDMRAHASRHLPNGVDPIASASAIGLSLVTTNTTGTANSFARSDHTHQITGVQPLDSDLTAIAALTTNGIIARTGTGTMATRSIGATAGQLVVTNADAIAGNPTLGLATTGVVAAQYDRITVDAYGRATGGLLDTDTFTSIMMDSPSGNGWPVTTTATAALDPTYTTITVRSFDDSRSEGIGITTAAPTGASTLKITIMGRPRTSQTANRTSVWALYARRFPIGATPPAWSAANAMTTITTLANNITFTSTSTTFDLDNIGLVAGDACQLEIVRVGANGSDTLSGDFMVLTVRIDWT